MKHSWLAESAASLALIVCVAAGPGAHGATRARDLGVPFHGVTGALNAITDVAGVEVGHTTLNAPPRSERARTGVTAILPLGRNATAGVLAGQFSFNGAGEMTGTHVVREFGALYGPILLTGTASVGAVSAATLQWVKRRYDDDMQRFMRILPVVGETYDGDLNDAWGFYVQPEHVSAALDSARGGAVAEGSVGGGTGMIAHDFKAGIGTASRIVEIDSQRYTVGALVQANYGNRETLMIAGVPVGHEIADLLPKARAERKEGSIIIVIATDAPLSSTQLERIAKRATVGLARVGGIGGATSGDLFLAFSTANKATLGSATVQTYRSISPEFMSPLFQATADATEEAIVNSLVAAETMTGYDGLTVYALPHDRLQSALRKYGRLSH